MKKMYKKPLTETVPVNTQRLMDGLKTSSGGTESLDAPEGGLIGNVRRRTKVF